MILLAELHADLFSRHASPLEVYVFVAVDEIGEYVMPDEICGRCNAKQQRRRRGGRSVQLPDWFMILHSSSRHFMHVRVYARATYHQIYSAKRREKPPDVRSRDRRVEHVCKNSFFSGSIS